MKKIYQAPVTETLQVMSTYLMTGSLSVNNEEINDSGDVLDREAEDLIFGNNSLFPGF